MGTTQLFRISWLALALLLPGACAREAATPKLESGPIRWDSFPVSIDADEALFDGGPAEDDLRAALAFWERQAGKTLFQLGRWRTGRPPYSGDTTNPAELFANVIFLQQAWPAAWTPRIAGRTVLFANGSRIRNAVIFLNAEIELCDRLCEESPGSTSRRRLITHELGHFLGLDHSPLRGDIMYPDILSGGSLEEQSSDRDRLKILVRN